MNRDNSESEASSKPSALAQVINLFVAPAQALDYARARPGMWWLPLGILMLLNAALALWWALAVNLKAFHLAQVQMLTRLHPDHAAQFSHAIMNQGRGWLFIGAIASTVFIAILALLYALYLFLADKLFSADSRGYGQWFSFTAWTWLPTSLAFIVGIIALAVSGHANLQPTDITSLNYLFFHFKPWDHLYRITQFSILNFWVIGLMTYGLKRWRNHSTGKALTIAIAPYVVVYLIMYLV